MKDKSDKYYTKKQTIFDLPMRLLIVGKSQLSGKTNLVANLLLDPNGVFYKNDFNGEDIIIVSSTATTDNKMKKVIKLLDIPATNVMTSYDEDILDGIYSMLEHDYREAVDNQRKPTPKLILLDDMSFGGQLKGKTHGIIAKLFCNGRHINVSTIVTSQKYTDILTTCRENATGLILFNCTDKQIELISDDHNYLESKKDFKRMFRDATNQKHSFMVVNYTNNPSERYLDKNFKPLKHQPVSGESDCGCKDK